MIDFDTGEWDGLEGMAEEVIDALKPRARNLVEDGGVMAESTVKEMLSHPGKGRTYIVSKTGAAHIASAPGDPPAPLFGHLKNSIGHSDPAWVADGWETRFGPGLGISATGDENPENYAKILEFGGITRGLAKILPRPYMEPSIRKLEPILERLFGGL